jgi:hypothetical protein
MVHAGLHQHAQLVALQWRLFSLVFPMMPVDGYPIGFRPDGGVTAVNLAGVTRWTMAAETLDLLSAEGRQLYRFHWSGSVGADSAAPAAASKPASGAGAATRTCAEAGSAAARKTRVRNLNFIPLRIVLEGVRREGHLGPGNRTGA